MSSDETHFAPPAPLPRTLLTICRAFAGSTCMRTYAFILLPCRRSYLRCKLPTAKACELSPLQSQHRHCHLALSHRRRSDEPVYGDSFPRNLERFNPVGKAVPLEEGLDGHGETRLPIGVDDFAALFASERGIIAYCVSTPYCTAAGTPTWTCGRHRPCSA